MRSDGIPKKFQLLGHTITVKIVPPSKWKRPRGHTVSRFGRTKLSTPCLTLPDTRTFPTTSSW